MFEDMNVECSIYLWVIEVIEVEEGFLCCCGQFSSGIKEFLTDKKGAVTISLPCNIFMVRLAGADMLTAVFKTLLYGNTWAVGTPVSFKVYCQPLYY